MKREGDVKELLIANAIRLVAQGGFESATTKELTHGGATLPDFKMNEVYIYRIFGGKEGLFETTFLRLDAELFEDFKNNAREVGTFEGNTKEKLFRFFLRAWNFILSDESKCRYYMRYCYSIYFKGTSLEAHNKHFNDIISDLKPVFKDEVDVSTIFHSVFAIFFDFGIQIFNGQIQNDEVTRFHIFNTLYGILAPYFKNPIKE